MGVFHNEIMLENKTIPSDDDRNVLTPDVEDVKKVCGSYTSIYYLPVQRLRILKIKDKYVPLCITILNLLST